MAGIELAGIAHRYHGNDAYSVNPLNQHWQDGGAYALLGPSGCGKTTLLNIISGLLSPTDGKVLFDGQDMTGLRTEQRNIAQVFQFPVVYDTLSVAENLAFPLRNRGLEKLEVSTRVKEVLTLLGMTGRGQQQASSLNADDKQKISLGRGLVRTDVNAILFDEPLTVIDPHLKWQLRTELKKIHRQFGHTMIYVTHDQTEALTFADQVVVMYEGSVVQIGTPQQLFDKPQHTFVGSFIGSPGMNIIRCGVDGSDAIIEGNRIPLHQSVTATGDGLELGIRPEHIQLSGSEGVSVEVTAVEDVGKHIVVRTRLAEQEIDVIVREGTAIPERVFLKFDAAKLNLYQDSFLLDSDP